MPDVLDEVTQHNPAGRVAGQSRDGGRCHARCHSSILQWRSLAIGAI
jgi:hypothetical protein